MTIGEDTAHETALSFDGKSIAFQPGQSVAAALTAAGVRSFRQTAKGATRGIFCGMGVCQDCLVTLNGVPNIRTCMTPAQAGMQIETQVAFPSLATISSPVVTGTMAGTSRVMSPDVLVIGGGVAGLSAAIAARAGGANVVLLDERKIGGGQYYKQSAVSLPLDRQQADGAALQASAHASGAEILPEVQIWGAFEGPLFLAEQRGTALVVRPRRVIVATGAYERPEMVPGWTLPGVMTTGAAQTLWRSYRTLPGKRVAIFGSGPLNLQVAQELQAGGAEVVVVAERAAAPWHQPVRLARLSLAGPRLLGVGMTTYRALRRAGVRVSYDTRLVSIAAQNGALLAHYTQAGKSQQVVVDALLMNTGFEPQNEILRLLGAQAAYDPGFGHLRIQRDDTCETSVSGVYAVGDCAGLGGALAAEAEGRIAGRAAAAAVGFGDGYDSFADHKALARHRRFQRCLWALHDIAPRLPEVPDETIICRCEELTAGQIRAGIAEKPGHLGSLKRATRLGMGRCQGRYCGPVGARLVAAETGQAIVDHSYFAPRVPIKPVAIATILAAEEALKNAL